MQRGLIGSVLALVGLLGCTATGATPPPPTWPVVPEALPAATSGSAELTLTCGDRTFPEAGLYAHPGAEKAQGPEFDALRATLAKFESEFPGSAGWSWQLAGRDETGATFLAKTNLAPIEWASIEVSHDAAGWKPVSMGSCQPQVVLSAEFGPASWALDPAFAAPGADTTELRILVWERACSGGAPATGRMSAPVIQYAPTSVTVTIGVRPPRADPGIGFACPMPPGTPAVLRLQERLGNRTLLDGGHVPPAPPSPANG